MRGANLQHYRSAGRRAGRKASPSLFSRSAVPISHWQLPPRIREENQALVHRIVVSERGERMTELCARRPFIAALPPRIGSHFSPETWSRRIWRLKLGAETWRRRLG